MEPAEQLREMAWECRMLAMTLRDEAARRELFLVAERFERLARIRDRNQADPARSIC